MIKESKQLEQIVEKYRTDFLFYAVRLPEYLNNIELFAFSDSHYGDPFCSWKHCQRLIDYVEAHDNARMVLTGDLMDCRIKSSPGYTYGATASPQKQKKFLLKQLLPIKSKIIGATTGNHEDRIYNTVDIDYTEELAEDLEIPYDRDGIFLKISWGDNNGYNKGKPNVLFTYHTHGFGSARTAGAQLIKVERQAEQIHASIVTMSHDHAVMGMMLNYLIPDPRTHIDKLTGFEVGKVQDFKKLPIKTGAFLKYGGYGRKLGYKPRPLRTPRITLIGGATTDFEVTF